MFQVPFRSANWNVGLLLGCSSGQGRAPGPWPLGPAIHGMSSSGTAAEGEAAPAQPASEKEPDMPSPREESEEEDEDDS